MSEGAGKTGCRPGTRGPLCEIALRRSAQRHTGEAQQPAFPAQWFYGLCRALPGERCTIAPVALRMANAKGPVGPSHYRKTWRTGSGRQDDTVLPYADHTGRVRAVFSLTVARPATTFAPVWPASTTAHPAFVTIAIRPSDRGELARECDKSEIL